MKVATSPQFPDANHWVVTAVGNSIELRAAIRAHLTGPVRRLTCVAAGTALLAARLAVAVAGARPFTTLVPNPQHPALLAVLCPGIAAEPTRAERALYRALVRPEPLPPGRLVGPALPLLRRAADVEGAWLRTVTDQAHGARWVAAVGRGADVDPDAALFVLGSHSDLPAGEIRAGQALRRVLLTAQAFGLRSAVLAGPVELSDARLRAMPGARVGLMPQALLVVGPHATQGC